jgi:MraZ protein
MLVGSHVNALDSKNRVFVPAALRADLGDRFMLNRGTDPKHLYIYPMKEWQAFEEKLGELPLTQPKYQTIVRYFTEDAVPCELDSQGRILIPQRHRELAGIDREVLFIGTIRGVQVWSPERYAASRTDNILELLEDANLSF